MMTKGQANKLLDENALLREIIIQKNILLGAYRIGSHEMANKALKQLDYLYHKLGEAL